MIRLASFLLASAVVLTAQTAAPAGPAQAKPGGPSAAKSVPGGARSSPGGAAPSAPSYKDLKYPPLRPIQLPRLDSSTLPNGIRLVLLPDRELPLVEGMALVHTGALLDPAGKPGLANFTALVMRTGGAGTISGDQVSQRLEDVAASIETAVTPTSATFTFSALAESAPQVLAIFKDVLTAPRFDESGLAQARSQARNAAAQRDGDGAGIAQRELSDILYGRANPHPGEPPSASFDTLSRAALVAFHARYFFPKNVILAIRGDFDSAAMKAQVEKLFADWTVDQPPPPPFPKAAPAPADAPGLYLVTKKDLRQTSLAMGLPGGLLNDKDYPALTLMADILGGGEGGRIAQRLRSLSPGAAAPLVSAKWETGYDFPGLFEIYGTVNSLSTVETIKAVREEVARIRSTEVTGEELRTARESAMNHLVFAFDTPSKTLARLMNYQYYGYPGDFLDRYQKGLAAVTRADVLRVARERLQPDAFATVVVGDPADFIPPLDSLGKVRPLELAAPLPVIEPVKSDASSAERGKAVLARLQKAVGGVERLAAVKDSTLVADYSVLAGGKVTPVRHTERWIAPLHYREDNDIGGGTISSYYDGSYGWISVPGGSLPLTGSALQQVQGNCFRQYVLLLQGGASPNAKVNAIDDLTLEIAGNWGESARIELDPQTSLPVRIRYQGVAAAGPRPPAEEVWSDFREVDGLRVPFRMAILQGGRAYADVTVVEFKVNSGLKLPDLDRRP